VGLTEKIRADSKLSDMPIILVTSLDSRDDRERGLVAGANAYIVKRNFEESNLLDTVRRLL
jgi:two-component system chemotaxis sensor kinase CheA